MSLPDSDDTIVAISTPPGHGGIGVIRISGKQAFKITNSIVREKTDFSQIDSHTIQHCYIKGKQRQDITDEVLISLFRSPKSYTGEDVIEISAHGNPVILQRIVDMIIDAGARQAAPGEFSLRAFLSGRIDLVQAESVADLVAARGEAAQRLATYQLSGKLSEYIGSIRKSLVEIAALFEAYTDFPDEDIPTREQRNLDEKLDKISEKLSRLADSYQRGKVIRNGIRIPIIGPSNAGKSSLFNAILAEERAIVTELPGTTRDTISESIELAGLSVKFIDTAGLRETSEQIEIIGVERSHREIKGANLLIFIIDITKADDRNTLTALESIGDKKLILALNKIDLVSESDIIKCLSNFTEYTTALISAKELIGLKNLLDLTCKIIMESLGPEESENTITNTRHVRAIERSLESVREVRAGLKDKRSFEFLAFDLRQAIDPLEELLGVVTSDDLLAEIFSRFCIGK